MCPVCVAKAHENAPPLVPLAVVEHELAAANLLPVARGPAQNMMEARAMILRWQRGQR